MFKKAVKHEAKLRLAIAGPSGGGKTYTSLALASELAQGKSVALVDTEHGSASKYADLFEFDVLEMSAPFHPDKFVDAIKAAAAAGYGVIVLDSLTHAWSGSGGLLDVVDEIAKRKSSGNTFNAWKDATPIQNRLVETIVSANIHVIATMRSKQDYAQEKDDRGKTVIRKIGMAPQQRDGFEYEFDVVFDMNSDNEAVVTKTRCPALTGRVIAKPGAETADVLLDWLSGVPSADAQPQHRNDPDQSISIPADVANWINQSSPVEAAKAWAIDTGACGNEHEAKNSLKKVVDAHGGRLNKSNLNDVLIAFHDRQLEKLAEMAADVEAEAAADEDEAVDVPFAAEPEPEF